MQLEAIEWYEQFYISYKFLIVLSHLIDRQLR